MKTISVLVDVACIKCGTVGQITDRQKRRHRQEGRGYICYLCRSAARVKPRPSDYNYWTSRFSQEEIQELAAALFE